jgi:hypothetical protein
MPKGINAMSRPTWLQKIYWTRFAKPIEERELFKQLISRPISSILEIGVGDGQRMRRLANLVQPSAGCEQVRYIGTDEFESAQDSQRHLSLKQAHQLASQLGFKASLIPGDSHSAIPRVAHKLGASDLLIIEGGIDPAQPLASTLGTWLNRLAHSDSVVLACQEQGQPLQLVDLQQLDLPIRIAA